LTEEPDPGDAMRPTIVYLHGFRSSPASAKAQLFVRAVAALPTTVRPRLHVPALQVAPAAAIAEVSAWIAGELGSAAGDELTLVGSSLGGYYATILAERYGARAALINPAVRPYDDLQRYVGAQDNLHTGERFEVMPAHFDELREMKVACITRPERYFLLQRSGDEVLDWREAVAFYAGAMQYVAGGGDHGWIDFADEIAAVLRFAGVQTAAA
jgi:predicted esterase YcpF (UPF0227 family)